MRTSIVRWVALAWGVAGISGGQPSINVEIPASIVEDKIRGGLLGQILGDLNGLKHEMKYIDEPGNVQNYTPELPDGAWTDDDTDIEWVYVVEMQRSRTLMLRPAAISEAWRQHINRRFWCSHQYLRQLMDLGIDPPMTGLVQFNPWAGFNLSGQFVSETWGLIAPGMPQTAARMGTHYTAVSIEGEPAQSTQMFASMIAAAFLTSDMETALDAGAAAVDPPSVMRRIIADVRRWHNEYPNDWRAVRKLIRDKYAHFGGHDLRDRNGVELNGAATIAALLYGRGDFVETARHAFNFGWDCDNNAATAGTVVGVMKGYRWLAGQGWNIKDRFRNTSRDRMPEDETITSFGDRLIELARLAVRENGGEVTGSSYRIATQQAKPVQQLADFDKQTARLRGQFHSSIERTLVDGGSSREMARAAYLGICLDLAPALARKYPGRWRAAAEALKAYPRVLQVLFYESDIPAGERLREKALAAGVERPPKIKMW